ncbi:MAG TPA: TIGR03790 family protein, partial [Verrucomicrobiae bacterium]
MTACALNSIRSKIILALSLALAPSLCHGETGSAVVVIYNTRMPASKDVANHYAARRNVPHNQVLGLNLPTDETMSRADYQDKLQFPLLRFLEKNKLIVYPSPNAVKPSVARIRYVVLCYGVPLRIAEDPKLIEPAEDSMKPELRRNGAAVDSELCTLPTRNPALPLAGPLHNPCFATTNATWFEPTNGILMVTRLDGPSASIALQLVDKAMEAETNGLWGRAYFDLRGLTNGPYKMGDDWIGAAAEISRNHGFETIVDKQPETFSPAFPMSQIALYAGWYDWNVSGPFTRPNVEFMPGAFAYHLHSFSAQSLRTTTQHWCGPLLADGATATMGCIDEPYLAGTPDIAVFFARWLSGFSFGEAAYACTPVMSWQTTMIGDPLFRPFGKSPRELHNALEQRHSKLVEWSYLQVIDKGLTLGVSPARLINYLGTTQIPQDSAVLTEKVSDLYEMEGEHSL